MIDESFANELVNRFIQPIKASRVDLKETTKKHLHNWETSTRIKSNLDMKMTSNDRNMTLLAALGPLPLASRRKTIDHRNLTLSKFQTFAETKKQSFNERRRSEN